MPVLKAHPTPDLTSIDLSAVDDKVLVVMVASVVALALRKVGLVYNPALRSTHAKWLLKNVPRILDKISSLRRPLLLELGVVLRSGGDRYLAHASRELATLFAKE